MTAQKSQNHKVTSLLQSMFRLQQQVDSLLISQVGIGLSAFRILSVTDDKKTCSQRHIAGLLSQTEANISRQVRHMAEQGLVKIAPDKKDKRQRNIGRTAKGQRLFVAAEKLLSHHEKDLKL